jgi:hypothetical protein
MPIRKVIHMNAVKNDAGETVFTGASDAECVRWYVEYGRSGDYLADTGELMSEVRDQLGMGTDDQV